MTALDAATLREATRHMADWLEGRLFGVSAMPGVDPREAAIATAAWAEGYRRAIFELRWAAQEPVVVPDDIGELDGGQA